MKKIVVSIFLLSLSIWSSAQNLSFYSKSFEHAVKSSIKTGNMGAITKSMADTVSYLDLSGHQLVEIDDILHFPNLKRLDLSGNRIIDVTPLKNLPLLEYLDISHNEIEYIEPLIFAVSPMLTVRLGHNYIKNFSGMATAPYCFFTLIGKEHQKDKRGQLVAVNQLFCSISNNGKASLTYAFQSNLLQNEIEINIGNHKKEKTVNDNYSHQMNITEVWKKRGLKDIEVIVRNRDSVFAKTYIIVPRFIPIKNSVEKQLINLELPKGYSIGSIYNSAKQGQETNKNSQLYYSLSRTGKGIKDTLRFSYIDDGMFRGYSYCVLYTPTHHTVNIIKPANGKITVLDQATHKEVITGTSFPAGTVLTIKAIANNGYKIDTLKINNQKVPNNYEFVLLDNVQIGGITHQSTSIENIASPDIKLYSRSSRLYITAGTEWVGTQYSLYTVEGRLITTGKLLSTSQEILLPTVYRGVCFIRFFSQNRTITKKILL